MSEDKKLNEVIRVERMPNCFVMMDKAFLENVNLSWKAKGILAYLLSKPDDWKVIVGDVVKRAADGKSAVYSGLAELKGAGCYEKKPIRDYKGVFDHWESTVYELPQAVNPENTHSCPLTDFPEVDNPEMENPFMENREHSNNYNTENDWSKNNSQSSPLRKPPPETDRPTAYSTERIQEIEAQLKANVDYDDLQEAGYSDMPLVDEIIAIIVDVLASPEHYIALEGEKRPRTLVCRRLLELDYWHLQHVIGQYKAVTTPIKRKRQYLLTMLYNAKLEFDAHYINLTRTDRGRT